MRKCIISLVVLIFAAVGYCDIIATHDGGASNGVLLNEYYVQHFTVPVGWTLNKAQFHMYYQNLNAKKWVYAEIFSVDDTSTVLAQGTALPWGNWFFVEAANLELGAGDYYVQALCYDPVGKPYLGAIQYTNSNYTDGYAATGLQGGTPLAGGTVDFPVYLDFTVPEPATMGLLGVGGVVALFRRKRNA